MTLVDETELYKAFAKAQAAFEVPKKTKQYLIQNKPVKYADLADVIEAVKKPLGDNGFSVTHRIGYCKGPFGLSTILMHASGHSLETWYPLPDIAKQSIRPQDFGGQLTYARRYSLSALLGVASDEDTDAAGSEEMEKQKGKTASAPKVEGAQGAGPKPATTGPKPIVTPPPPPKAEDVAQSHPIEINPSYVIPFGPVYVKGKVLRTLEPNVVKTYLNTVVDTAASKNEEIKGAVLEFCVHAEAYLQDFGQ